LANLKLIITWRFFLEAKAFWEHTCIAGGLFLLPIQAKRLARFIVFQVLCITFTVSYSTALKLFNILITSLSSPAVNVPFDD